MKGKDMVVNNLEEKKCGKSSCGCMSTNEAQSDDQKKLAKEAEEKILQEANLKKDLDPTHFGDWQVNCRAIDF